MMFSKFYCLVYLDIISFKFIFYFLLIFSEVAMKNERGFEKKRITLGWHLKWYNKQVEQFIWNMYLRCGRPSTVGDDRFFLQRKAI